MKKSKLRWYYILISAFLLIPFTALAQQTNVSRDTYVFKPDSASLMHYQVPQWFKNAKFGIFIHWGVYSVPAFGSEWYPHFMYIKGSKEYKHQIKTYGPLSKFGYKNFIPMFKAQDWNPNKWAELFKKSGARYVVEVAMHHDGFAMYDSKVTKWNAYRMGPHKNIVADLAKAVRAHGLKFGVSDHYANNWYYYTYADHYDTKNPKYAGLYAPEHPKNAPPNAYFLNRWYNLAKEMVDDFHPAILYFDWKFEEPAFKPYRYKIAAYYYNQAEKWGKTGVLNYKNDAFPKGSAVFEVERGRFKHVRRPHWQTGTSVATNTWGYTKDAHYRTSNSLVDELVDIVSKNGNLLLNVDPESNGIIPEQAKNLLLNIGKWMSANGQAIYDTHPWKVFGEGPTHLKKSGSFTGILKYTGKDIRFTAKDGILYATALAWPGKEMVIHSLASSKDLNNKPIQSVEMLANHQNLKFRMEADGLHIMMPDHKIGHYAYTVKIKFKQ